MWFLVLGLLLLCIKVLGLEPLADLPWAFVLSPFLMAAGWWALSDRLGWTEKAALWRERERKLRVREARSAFLPGSRKLSLGQRLMQRWRAMAALRNETERQERWQRNTEILRSSFYENSVYPETATAQATAGGSAGKPRQR